TTGAERFASSRSERRHADTTGTPSSFHHPAPHRSSPSASSSEEVRLLRLHFIFERAQTAHHSGAPPLVDGAPKIIGEPGLRRFIPAKLAVADVLVGIAGPWIGGDMHPIAVRQRGRHGFENLGIPGRRFLRNADEIRESDIAE